MIWGSWDDERRDRFAWLALAVAMSVAVALLLWEGRGLTLFVDEWTFGYLGRHGFGASELLEPDNGHLAVLPILVVKASLALFGAGTALPLRLVALGTHLAIASMLFLLLRRSLGPLAALPPTVLFLFLGAAFDVVVGSHALPIQIAVATGLAAWIVLGARTAVGDAGAAILLIAGLASNGFAIPFVLGAAAILLLDDPSTRRRLWVVGLPLALYAIWWLAYGRDAGGQASFENLAGLPAYAFHSLAAELAALTGLFAEPGVTGRSFLLGPGEALAGAVLVALVSLWIAGRWRPPRMALPPLVALLAVWLTTGLVASASRLPQSGRYLYAGVVLVLLFAAAALASSPWRVRGSLVLAAICAFALLPSLREIHYGGTYFRELSDQDRAVLAAVDLLGNRAPGRKPLVTESDMAPGGVADMKGSLGDYREGKRRFGSPAFSPGELASAHLASRETADRVIARVLSIQLEQASGSPRPLPAGLRVSRSGGRLRFRHGCLELAPTSATAFLFVAVPPGGLWIRPRSGPVVPVALRRFADGFAVPAGAAVGGRPSQLRLPPGAAGRDWEAQLQPQQALVVCGAPALSAAS